MKNLKELVVDLVGRDSADQPHHNHQQVLSFNGYPEVWLAKYRLTSAEWGAFFKVNRLAIADLIKNDYGATTAEYDYWRADWTEPEVETRRDLSQVCLDAESGGPEYPEPTPEVYKVTPHEMTGNDTTPQEITVHGQGLISGGRILMVAANGTELARADGCVMRGTWRCGETTVSTIVKKVSSSTAATVRFLNIGLDRSGAEVAVEVGSAPVTVNP